jgi:hypothetical protein
MMQQPGLRRHDTSAGDYSEEDMGDYDDYDDDCALFPYSFALPFRVCCPSCWQFRPCAITAHGQPMPPQCQQQ